VHVHDVSKLRGHLKVVGGSMSEPSGRNHDPDRLPPRLAGVRVVRSAMVAGRVGHWPATRPQGEERLAAGPSDARWRDTRAATPAARTGGILARLHDRAGRADDAQGLPCAIRSDRGSGQDAIPDPSAHAAAWLRLRPSQRRPRHTGATSLARPQKHPTHVSLYRTFACPLPRLLEGERPLNESVLPLRDSRTSETASGGLRLWRLVGGLAYGSLPTGSASIHRQCSASAALS